MKFEYLNPREKSYETLPEDITVLVMDYDPLFSDDILAEGETDADGKVHFRISDKTIKSSDLWSKPDIYFKVVPNGRMVNGVPLPKSWKTRLKRDASGGKGYYADFKGTTIVSADSPVT